MLILPSYPEFEPSGHPESRHPTTSTSTRPKANRMARHQRWLLPLLLLLWWGPTSTLTTRTASERCSEAEPATYLRRLHSLKTKLRQEVLQLNQRLARRQPTPKPTHGPVARNQPARFPRLVQPVRGVPLPTEPDLLVDAPRKYRGVRARHHSIDFYAPYGTPVYAAMDGVVVHADREYQELEPTFRNSMLDLAAELGDTPPTTYQLLIGRHVLLDHGCIGGQHWVTAYNHLSSLRSDLKVGGFVQAGECIARVGNSGTSSAANGLRDQDCHLDFAILVNDKPLGTGLEAREQVRLFGSLFSMPAVSYRASNSH